jgi:endonuclease/exonuclease/phosphatase family metal-dependent hydrolase
LRVLTWNVLGLKWISSHREARLSAIAEKAAQLRPDIAAFQEAFVERDREVLAQKLSGPGLSHSQYFPSGLVGSGLFVVSRFPLESAGFVRFEENGRPEALQHGDWWAGKGLSLSTVTLPEGLRLYLGTTHFHARYGGSQYQSTQLAQATQLIPWARRVEATGSPALWMGDWNSRPTSDVLTPLIAAGEWRLLSTAQPRIDHIFGSGAGWEWHVLTLGKANGKLPLDPPAPWSDHDAVWLDVELRRSSS